MPESNLKKNLKPAKFEPIVILFLKLFFRMKCRTFVPSNMITVGRLNIRQIKMNIKKFKGCGCHHRFLGT